jgi:hypothetical protein
MIRYLVGTLTALSLGCASYPDVNREQLQNFPQRYTQYDLYLAWQVRSVGSQTVVEGDLVNRRYQYLDNIAVWVAVLDAAGRPLARSVSYVIPHQLKRNDVAPFSMKLPVPALPGTRLRFSYTYTASDGGSGSGGFWTQSFEAVVPNP